MIVCSWILAVIVIHVWNNETVKKCVCLTFRSLGIMGSCVCKEKTTARSDTPSQTTRSNGRHATDGHLGGTHTESGRSDVESSTSSGYHGSQILVTRTTSKKTVRSLVLETLSVIRTLIDKCV